MAEATIISFSGRAGVTQLVECDLAKVDVAGSNPVSRSKNIGLSFLFNYPAPELPYSRGSEANSLIPLTDILGRGFLG
jgi:hypothetical protein